MDPFGYALTPLFWIITGGIIIALELSGRKPKRTRAKKPRSKTSQEQLEELINV